MRNLIEFLSRYNHWLLFIVLEVLSMVLLFRFNAYQGSVWFTSANAVAGQFYAWDSAVESFFSLTKVNQQLAERNLMLERRVADLQEQLKDATGDTLAPDTSMQRVLSGYRLIPAKVVSTSLNRPDNLITIDRGAEDGVRKDMGVACGNGIVGVVYLTSAHYSIVIPVLNEQSRISCKLSRWGYFGYLSWVGGATDEAYLEDIPRHAHFYLGDEVVTSGFSSLFPAGIIVGRVLHVYNSADGLSYRLKVKLSTDFGNLRNVFVIDNSAMQERMQDLKAAEDSIKEREN